MRRPALSLTLAIGACAGTTYPPARRGDVVEVHHGQRVPDPYRWLEDPASPEVTAWVRAENAHTDAQLERIPDRAALRARVAEVVRLEWFGNPRQRSGRYFWAYSDGRQDQKKVFTA